MDVWSWGVKMAKKAVSYLKHDSYKSDEQVIGICDVPKLRRAPKKRTITVNALPWQKKLNRYQVIDLHM